MPSKLSPLHAAVRKMHCLPYHRQIELVKIMGVEGSVTFDQYPHEMLKDFFSSVATLGLKERFIYEMDEYEKNNEEYFADLRKMYIL